jgi:ADP-Ribosyltransferase in polyvalent proteins
MRASEFIVESLNDNFKQWFGSSKVVDATGKPMVVYHGTTADFREFSLSHRTNEQGIDQYGTGFYLAQSPELASHYAGTSGSVMPLYARIVKPMNERTRPFNARVVEKLLRSSPEYRDSLMNFGDVDYEGERKVLQGAVNGFLHMDNALSQINMISNDFWRGHDQAFLNALITTTGFDGFVVNGHGGKVFVAWSPSQLKSATGNSGKFDPTNADITTE